jgi:prepilin-type processing-associated H-X9-DG protein
MNDPEKARPEKKSEFSFLSWLLALFAFWIVLRVLFPVYIYSGPAQGGTCQSNLNQIGLGLIQYSQDFDLQFPNGLTATHVGNHVYRTGLGWASQAYVYIKNPDVFICPDDKTPKNPSLGTVISYAYNTNFARNPSTARLIEPEESILLFGVSGAHGPLQSWPTADQIAHGPLAPAGDGTQHGLIDGLLSPTVRLATGDVGDRTTDVPLVGRHDGGAYYLMADGHDKYYFANHVSSGFNASSSNGSQTGVYLGKAAGTANQQYEATFSTK